MTVLLPDMTTRTVNGDTFSVDDEGNLVINSSNIPVAAFAAACWAAVWVAGQVNFP